MLLSAELEHKVRRESVSVAFNRFVEAECRNAINARQIAIKDDSLTADFEDQVVNSLIRDR